MPFRRATGNGMTRSAPSGRQTYWKQMRDEIFSKGADGWWLDAPEPEIGGMGFRNYKTPMGPGYEVYNAYPLMHSMGIYQGQRAATDQKRVVILTRSAYAGQQRNSAITWSGDIQGTWEVLKNQIPAGLNFSLSGIPYWNTDTGGFFGNRSAGNGRPRQPASIRNFSRAGSNLAPFVPCSACMVPMACSPGKEFWRFDEKTQGTLADLSGLALSPSAVSLLDGLAGDFRGQYLHAAAGRGFSKRPASRQHRRPISFWPRDHGNSGHHCRSRRHDQSICRPAVRRGITSGPARLPPPASASRLRLPSKLCRCSSGPAQLFRWGRSFSIRARNRPIPIELRIYRGADGRFTLYEDEGDNYNYEKGKYATIPISWNEAKHALEIGKRAGEFPGMLKERTFNIVWVSASHGAGVPSAEKPDAVVHYNGKAVKVSVP